MSQHIDIPSNLIDIISNPSEKERLVNAIMESLIDSPALTQEKVSNAPFYNNYADRVSTLLDNSLKSIALESVMSSYAPIVSYAPFFIKNQWVNCVYKDVLMTEVPTSPVINLAYEKRYLKAIIDGVEKEYPIPEVNFDDAAMKELYSAATGLTIDTTKDIPLPLNQDIRTDNFIPGIVVKPGCELTPDSVAIIEATFTSDGETYSVPCNIRVDVTTHNFVKGSVKYDVTDDDGNVTKTLTDELIGAVDFEKGFVKVFSTASGADKVTSIKLQGRLANRWNERSLDVVRRVEHIQHIMPESGPRLNSGIPVEECADALALQNIDMVADNIDVMGRTLADFEDMEIRMFLKNSYDAQESAGVGPHGYTKLTVYGRFDTVPYDTYQGNISTWQNDSREYFERVVNDLKVKLRAEEICMIAVCHPNLVRYFKAGIDWQFNDTTEISGMKLNYNFGVMTSSSDRIHFITSQYAKVEDGISIIVIPLTKNLITFKHFKYDIVVDRGYRNPVHTLIPNIMATQRTLTFEVLPVQGKMEITGRELISPTTLSRS